MIPQNVLSATPQVGAFLSPRDLRTQNDLLLDYELGGTAIGDATAGLQVATWRAQYIANQIVLDKPSVPSSSVAVLTQANIIELAFTFDQSMRVFLAYTLADTTSNYYWYDTTIPGFTTTTLPAGSNHLRCSLDDKRALESSSSDIILSYQRAGNLYYRQQRDRYLVEYLLDSGFTGRQIQAGLTNVNRYQFVFLP